MNVDPERLTVVVRGAGDLGSGVLFRLWRAGFSPVVLERPHPLTVRRQVAFATALEEGTHTVEGITAEAVDHPDDLESDIPILTDPEGEWLGRLMPDVLVDASMVRLPEKIRTRPEQADLTVGLGPGFEVGRHVDLVVETNRGHNLGRVYHRGSAEASTGVPGTIAGKDRERLLRAPDEGEFEPRIEIGDRVEKGQILGTVGGTEVTAGVSGIIRGLIAPGTPVHEGLKIGDIDPREDPSFVDVISDKSRAVGGGVLEAVFWWYLRRPRQEGEPSTKNSDRGLPSDEI